MLEVGDEGESRPDNEPARSVLDTEPKPPATPTDPDEESSADEHSREPMNRCRSRDDGNARGNLLTLFELDPGEPVEECIRQ